ncbi:MAG TPA: phytase [Polyangiaceae bacterium]|nr:phytase [Polyangiaceae bacterium]
MRIGWRWNQVLKSALLLPLVACSENGGTTEATAVSGAALEPLPTLTPQLRTSVLHQYDDAPRTPDADDPAIWVNHRSPGKSLVLGTLKDGGLAVYDLSGAVVQTVLPPNRPAVSAEDPPVAGSQPDPGTSACAESESGETFGRFNNVDVVYDFPLRKAGRVHWVDLAVLTDRGCDRLRSYVIDREASEPLREVTASDAPRAFPSRFEQPSPVQSPGAPSRVVENPLDDQSTAYGITLTRLDGVRGSVQAFVTQRSRSTVAQFELYGTPDGHVSYKKAREFRFEPVFRIPAESRRPRTIAWTPCREDPSEDLQFEGLVVDAERGILYAAQEVVGLWRIELDRRLPKVVRVPQSALFEKTKSFGLPYWAVPDGDEFSCESSAPDPLPAGTLAVAGNPAAAGEYLEADAEGLAIYPVGRKSGYLIASSQGDNTFHVFDRDQVRRHLGAFKVEGTGDTDGHAVAKQPLGDQFPFGLFVNQNGAAPEPASTDPINGYEYDGSTQFEFLGWQDIAAELGLAIDLE